MAAKPASASHTVVHYDFEKNPMLGEHYRNPYGSVRIGRVLEDLDALAGTIAFKHTKPRAPKRLMLVTASVDRITLLHNAGTESDMMLSGSVAWVGRSSMVIRMLAHSHSVRAGRSPWLEADFTFVARDPATLKSVQINPLELSTDEARAVFASIGEQVEADRISRAAPPCVDANSAAAAQLVARASAALLMPALADPGAVLMSQTRQGNVFVCQPQHRNTADRIFGGLLMRRAYELAFATAFLFGGSRPQFIEVDRVRFVAPVEVGDLLKLEATVLYTTPKRVSRESARLTTVEPPEIHVEVVAHVTRPDARSVSVVNTFLLTFALPEAETVKTVLPSSVEEAQRMLQRMAADEVQQRLRRAAP
jgi:acyl-coenzyme A thioesterase 9